MSRQPDRQQPANFTSRKVNGSLTVVASAAEVGESLTAWIARYVDLAVTGVRSEAVAQKIGLHLERFHTFYIEGYGHERISTVLKRDVVAWQRALVDEGLAPATVNNHLA